MWVHATSPKPRRWSALHEQLHKITQQLVRLERQDVTGMNSRAWAIRCEAAELRRDINEAQILSIGYRAAS